MLNDERRVTSDVFGSSHHARLIILPVPSSSVAFLGMMDNGQHARLLLAIANVAEEVKPEEVSGSDLAHVKRE